jgi:hypothetical protein
MAGSTLDLFGDGYALLRFEAGLDVAALQSAAAARSVPLTLFDIDDAGIGALYEAKLAIVRPDGHVAWRGDDMADHAGALIAAISGHGGN